MTLERRQLLYALSLASFLIGCDQVRIDRQYWFCSIDSTTQAIIRRVDGKSNSILPISSDLTGTVEWVSKLENGCLIGQVEKASIHGGSYFFVVAGSEAEIFPNAITAADAVHARFGVELASVERRSFQDWGWSISRTDSATD